MFRDRGVPVAGGEVQRGIHSFKRHTRRLSAANDEARMTMTKQ